MRAQEFLNESLSRVAFHYTPLPAALKIIKDGEFKLSSSAGSVEEKYAPKGYPYFLSATRTMTGGYHNTVHSGGGVIFVLNGNWFNARYPAKPVDYWQDRNPSRSFGRHSEAEDRIYSKENSIPISGVSAVHILIKNPKQSLDSDAFGRARQLLIAAKQQGIPAHFYTDHSAWRSLNTNKTADISMLKGLAEPSRNYPSKNYLDPVQELIGKKSYNDLSDKAKSLARSLNYSYDKKSVIDGLNTDFSNYRKPSSGLYNELVKIIKFMQKNKLSNVAELVEWLAAKWKAQ